MACTASNVDNDWFWYDETPFTDYDNWDDLQPDGDGGCAAANLAGGFSRWEEVDCAARLGVFCKGPKGAVSGSGDSQVLSDIALGCHFCKNLMSPDLNPRD